MRAALPIFALALLVASSSATDPSWVWNGGTMNFADTNNWANQQAPTASNVTACSTTFGGPNRYIVSTMGVNTYFVGKTLRLPLAGGLRLATTGTTLVFTSQTPQTVINSDNVTETVMTDVCDIPESVNYVWTGGLQYEERNDFYCHKNWLYNSQPIQRVPCSQDDVFIPSTDTYQLVVGNRTNLVALRSITYGSVITVDSASSTNPSSLNLLYSLGFDFLSTSSNVVINTNGRTILDSFCKPLYDFVTLTDPFGQTSTSCVCYSTCPDAAMLYAEQQNIEKNMKDEAARKPTSFPVVPFSGTYTAASLSIPASVPLVEVFNRSAVLPALQVLSASVPNWNINITNVQLSVNGNSVVISGVVYNISISAIPGNPTTAPSLLSFTLSSVTPSLNSSRLVTILQSSLAPLLIPPVQAYLTNQVADITSQLPPSASTVLSNLTTIASNSGVSPTALLNISNNNDCFASCTTNCSDCAAALAEVLGSVSGISNDTAAALAEALINAKSSNASNWQATSSQINTVITQTQTVNNLQNVSAAITPVLFSMMSPNIYFGRSMSLSSQLSAISPQNLANFISSIQTALRRSQVFNTVGNVSVTWVPNVPSRRRTVNNVLTPSALVLTFTYTISCAPNDQACLQPFAPGSPIFANILTQINNAAQLATILPLPCIVSTGPNIGQLDSVCINNTGSSYCSALVTGGMSAANARVLTQSYLYNLTRCGSQPAYPDGSCVDNSLNASAILISQNVALNTPCGASSGSGGGSGGGGSGGSGSGGSGTAGSTGSGGGGGGLGLAAAGAGGGAAIIIIIIAIVIYRRRKNGTVTSRGGKSATDRTVVAFENPMYDDPSVNPQTTYDMAAHNAGRNDSEGLYDEPAFNANVKKMNPVYSSHEDLTADSGAGSQGGDGYLDVSPKGAEDVGYLDQGADRPEDIGYLEQRENTATYDNRVAGADNQPMYSSAAASPVYATAAESEAPNYADAEIPEAE